MLGTHVLHDGRTLVVIGRNAEHKIVGIYLDDRAARTGRFVVLDECELGPVVGRDGGGGEDVLSAQLEKLAERNRDVKRRLLSGQTSRTVGAELKMSQSRVTRIAWSLGLVFVGQRQSGRWIETEQDGTVTRPRDPQTDAIVARLLAGTSMRQLAREYHRNAETIRAIAQDEGLIYIGKNPIGKWIREEEHDMNESNKTAIVEALLSGRSVLDVGRQFGQNIPTINRIAESAGLVFERGIGSGNPGKWVKPAQTQAEYDELLVSDRERKAKEEEAKEVTSEQAEAIVVMQSHMQAHQPIDRPSDPDLAAAFDLLVAAEKRAADQKERIEHVMAMTDKAIAKAQDALANNGRLTQELNTVRNERATLESDVKRLNDELKKEISKTEAEREKAEQMRAALHAEMQKNKELIEKIDRGLFRAQLERTRATV